VAGALRSASRNLTASCNKLDEPSRRESLLRAPATKVDKVDFRNENNSTALAMIDVADRSALSHLRSKIVAVFEAAARPGGQRHCSPRHRPSEMALPANNAIFAAHPLQRIDTYQ
jgi:hypothetical protein